MKKRKSINRLVKMLSFVLMFSFLTLPTFAQDDLPIITDDEQLEEVEKEQLGSITITLEDTDEKLSKEGVDIALVKVANITGKAYELNTLFEDTGVDLMAIETAKQLEETAILLKNSIPKNVQVTSIKTDINGQVVFDGLGVGVYLIYPLDTAEYENISPFIIAIPTFDEEVGQMAYDLEIHPKHTPNPSIRVHKVDSVDKTKVLKEAEFTLYDENMVELQVVSTNANGIAEFYNVKNGTYFLKETKAPQGYRLSKDPIEVVVNEEYNGEKLFEITVPNALLPIIQTGDNANVSLYIGVALLSLSVLGFVVGKKKFNKQED